MDFYTPFLWVSPPFHLLISDPQLPRLKEHFNRRGRKDAKWKEMLPSARDTTNGIMSALQLGLATQEQTSQMPE